MYFFSCFFMPFIWIKWNVIKLFHLLNNLFFISPTFACLFHLNLGTWEVVLKSFWFTKFSIAYLFHKSHMKVLLWLLFGNLLLASLINYSLVLNTHCSSFHYSKNVFSAPSIQFVFFFSHSLIGSLHLVQLNVISPQHTYD